MWINEEFLFNKTYTNDLKHTFTNKDILDIKKMISDLKKYEEIRKKYFNR